MTETLIVIAIVLLLAVVIMLGVLLRRRKSTDQSPVSASQKPSANNEAARENTDNPPARRRNPNNPEYISATKECLRELSQSGTNLCISELYQTIPAKFQELDRYLAENQSNFSLEVIWNSISFVIESYSRLFLTLLCWVSYFLIKS